MGNQQASFWNNRLFRGLVLLCGLSVVGTQAFAQQTASLEYYLEPVPGAANTMSLAGGQLAVSAQLEGTTLTFINEPFAGQYAGSGNLGLTSTIDATVNLPSSVPTQPTSIGIAGGTYQLVSTDGEIISGTFSSDSMLEVVPYGPLPRLLMVKVRLIPATTVFQGPANGVDATVSSMVVFGFILTNGSNFVGTWAFPGNDQYEVEASVN